LLWFKPDHDVEIVPNLEAGTLRIHRQVSPAERRLQVLGLCIAFLMFSLLPSMALLEFWRSESSSADDLTRQRQSSCAGLGMSTLLLRHDDIHCIDPMFPDRFQSDDSWQLGDEQHLALGSDGNGGYPEESLFKITLLDVDVETLTLRPNRRIVHHSDEYSSSTTEHPGVDLIVNTGRGVHAFAFVENDDTGERHELIAKLSSAIRGQVVDASFVESDAPSLVEPAADSSELAPAGALNTPVDEQLVIEQVAPVEVFGALSAVKDDVATDDVKHRPRDIDSEPTDVSQAIQGGGFWNFEAEDVKE